LICDQNTLNKARKQTPKPCRQVFGGGRKILQFERKLLIAGKGTRNQFWKKQQVGRK